MAVSVLSEVSADWVRGIASRGPSAASLASFASFTRERECVVLDRQDEAFGDFGALDLKLSPRYLATPAVGRPAAWSQSPHTFDTLLSQATAALYALVMFTNC